MVDKNSLEFFQKWNEFKKVFLDIAQSQMESDKKKFEEIMGGTFANLQEATNKMKGDKIRNPHYESLIQEYKRCYQRELDNMTKLSTDLNYLMKEIDDDVEKLEKGLAENGVPISMEDKKRRNKKIREKKRLMLTNINVQSFDDVNEQAKDKTVLDKIGGDNNIETHMKTDNKPQIKHKKTRRARNRANKIAKEEMRKKTEDAKINNKPYDEKLNADSIILPTKNT